MKRRRAFTLIELLVVIAIIVLLVSILMPSLQKAKELAKAAYCAMQIRNVQTGLNFYAEDHDRWICPPWTGDVPAAGYSYDTMRMMLGGADPASYRGIMGGNGYGFKYTRKDADWRWFVCPSDTRKWDTMADAGSYGLNPSLGFDLDGSGNPRPGTAVMIDRYGRTTEGFFKLDAAVAPAGTYLLGDNQTSTRIGKNSLANDAWYLRPDHSGRNNMSFIDGHVITSPFEAIPTSLPQSAAPSLNGYLLRPWWNRDAGCTFPS